MKLQREIRFPVVVTLCLTAISGAFTLAGCGQSEPAPTVKVAASVPTRLPAGREIVRALELAFTEARARPGAVPVELVVFDTTTSREGHVGGATEEETAARAAAADPAIVAYLGPTSTYLARHSLPILNEAGMSQISQGATWPGLTKIGFGPGEPSLHYPHAPRHFFRVVATDDHQGRAAAQWVHRMGARRVFIVNDGLVASRGVAGIFEVAARDLGIEIVGRYGLDVRRAEIPERVREAAEQAVAAAPDLVYYATALLSGGTELIAELRRLAPELPIVTSDAVVQDDLVSHSAGGFLEGVYATSMMVPVEGLDTDLARAFAASFEKAHGEPPSPMAVSSYEAARVVLLAIEEAEEPGRAGVLAALRDLGEVDGLLGRWSFDEGGDIDRACIAGLRVTDGSWRFEAMLEVDERDLAEDSLAPKD